MKKATYLKKVFVVILSISVAGILFAGVGCEKGAEVGEAPSDIAVEEGELIVEGEAAPEAEAEPEAEAPAEALATDAFGDQIAFVKEGGDGDGTKDNPMGDINEAITYAKSTWTTPSAIVVAEGTYNVDWSTGDQIKMAEDVSLYGGFSTDWKNRGTSYITTIKNMSTSGLGVPDNPDRAVEFKSGITKATVIDGFEIEGGGSGSGSSAAIFTDNASPTIANNKLDGGNADKTVGVYNVNSSPFMYNNVIDGGAGSTASYGISVNDGAPKIYNNTIDGGSGSNYSSGIFIYNGGSPWIDNNIIFTTTSGAGYGIYEYNANSDPKEVKNNVVFKCSKALYHDHDGGDLGYFNKICDGNFGSGTDCFLSKLATPTGKDNITTQDIKFVGADDWHLTNSSPAAATSGGLDGAAGWGFTMDKDGNERTGNGTTGWSMGAYEFDTDVQKSPAQIPENPVY